MKKSFILLAILAGLAFSEQKSQAIEPTGTYIYAQKDSVTLMLDYYDAAPGSKTTIDGKQKPAIVFVFGGGFFTGSRREKSYDKWFTRLTNDGFKVFSIDYRLGLKGVKKMGVAQRDLLEKAVQMAVDDLYSATAFICENANEFGVDPANIVTSGSSAGAITIMQAEWERANSHPAAAVLPEGFKYAGVMSFSGAVYSKEGKVKYKQEPAPTFMFHGTNDRIVTYKQIWFFNIRFAGSSIVEKTFKKMGYNHRIYRYEGHGHEVSMYMDKAYDEEMAFIYTNVMKGKKVNVDAVVNDGEPAPTWGAGSQKKLYASQK